jgi:hypothetical protein
MTNINYLFSCAVWFRKQALIFKKIIHPGPGKNLSRIQGGKKAPDPELFLDPRGLKNI